VSGNARFLRFVHCGAAWLHQRRRTSAVDTTSDQDAGFGHANVGIEW